MDKIKSLFMVAVLFMLMSRSVSAGIIDCTAMFSQTSSNPYAGVLAGVTGYGPLVQITMLLILMMFSVISIIYMLGSAFQIESFLTFARTEMLEQFGNVIILAAIGTSFAFAAPAITFFASFASLGSSGASSVIHLGPNANHAIYVDLCNNIQSNIINRGIENWLGVYVNLFITNILSANAPPGGFTITLMPFGNNFGVAMSPFQALSVLTQLLWDDQLFFFGSIFMGALIIVLLFFIFFLFPLFLYLGVLLRSFPWTRAAGGSFIALFVSFYIIFPGLLYPFLTSSLSTNSFCNPQSPGTASLLTTPCTASTFLKSANPTVLLEDISYDFGALYYNDAYAFIQGLEYSGVNLIGLIISLLICYELVEKIGSVLGAPSIQPGRAFGRLV